MNTSTIYIRILLILGIVTVINVLVNKYSFRLDFTESDRYTLSDATKNTLQELDDPVTITAYFSENLPPQLLRNRNEFRDLLIEYKNRSNGNIVYNFINPNESPELEREAQQKGIAPLMVNTTERDEVKQIRAYMGAVLELGNKQDVIPVIRPQVSAEYDLTTSIKELAIEDKPKIAFLQGHGEASPQTMAQAAQALRVLHDLEPYTITDTAEIPGYYRAIAIINPSDTFPENHLRKIERFLKKGKGIYLALNRVNGDLQSRRISIAPQLGLSEWVAQLGINLRDNYVIDAQCGSVTVQQQFGPLRIPSQISFPYFPILSNFSDHPSVQGLESVFLPFASSLSLNPPADSSYHLEAVAFTSESSAAMNPPSMMDVEREWAESDFAESNLPVAAVASGRLFGNADSKLFVITNGSFAVGGQGQQQQQVNEDNVNLTVNAIEWLSDDTGLISLRTKGITSRPIKELSDTRRSVYKYGNFLAPILLVIFYGLFRYQQNQKKRQRWIQNIY